jgi:PTH1 family peptidyl-tRNA hydrolase
MGIEHPGNKELVIKHVLSNFKKNELTIFDQINENISNNIDLLIKREYSTFMNKIKIQ